MIKLLRFVTRRKDLALEQFQPRWLNAQLQFGRTLPEGTRAGKIAVSLSTGELLGGTGSFFDGMVEMYFDQEEDARASISSAPWEALRNDESDLVDPSESSGYLVTDEYVTAQSDDWAAMAADASRPRTKVVRTVKRKSGLTRRQFKDYWLNQHSQLEKTRVVKTLTRRIAATFLGGELTRGKEPAYDGLVSLYYESVDLAKTHFAGGSQSVMRKDEENFVDLSYEVVRVIAQEHSAR